MKNENAVKFKELLFSDKNLQKRLKELADAYTGDKTDSEAFLTATVGKLAEELNLPFTYEEGEEIFNNDDDRELSEDEVKAIAGGKGFCITIGVSDGPEVSGEDDDNQHACAYIGVGV